MNPLSIPELFYQITINLNDKEKIFLTSCSKITYNSKSLIMLDSEYNLEKIHDKLFRVKNIIIKELINSESIVINIKELIENLIPKSIAIRSKYVRFISNNINVKLFYNREIISYLGIARLLTNFDANIQARDNNIIVRLLIEFVIPKISL